MVSFGKNDRRDAADSADSHPRTEVSKTSWARLGAAGLHLVNGVYLQLDIHEYPTLYWDYMGDIHGYIMKNHLYTEWDAHPSM